MNLDEIRISQLEDKYMNKHPNYRDVHGMFDFKQRIITLDYEDLEWLLSRMKELAKPKGQGGSKH